MPQSFGLYASPCVVVSKGHMADQRRQQPVVAGIRARQIEPLDVDPSERMPGWGVEAEVTKVDEGLISVGEGFRHLSTIRAAGSTTRPLVLRPAGRNLTAPGFSDLPVGVRPLPLDAFRVDA